MSDNLRVQDGQIVSMDYSLHIDGELIDSSEGHEPLDYLHGAGNIIPGLESELVGMAVGEDKSVIVSPELGVVYLGTQGDVWDAQHDMLLALLGATCAMLITWLAERGRSRGGV